MYTVHHHNSWWESRERERYSYGDWPCWQSRWSWRSSGVRGRAPVWRRPAEPSCWSPAERVADERWSTVARQVVDSSDFINQHETPC